MTPLAPLPTLRRPQTMEALDIANGVRSKRSELKRDLNRVGFPRCLALAARLIEEPPSYLGTMRLRELLLACPQVGPRHLLRLTRRAQILEDVQVARLADRQRETLVEALRERAWTTRNGDTA